jgi:zinc transporter ZupT
MALAGLLTLVAFCGVFTGVAAGRARTWSGYLSGAGGGLLFGISVFWVMPEIAAAMGWLLTILAVAIAATGLGRLHQWLENEQGQPGLGLLGPLLGATAIHSFLDGWSVRALGTGKVADVAVSLGLGLHKFPEGLALGWITRRLSVSVKPAIAACLGVELLTVLGAAMEPRVIESGRATFGLWWVAVVLAIISGSFLFLGFEAILPFRRRLDVIVVFLGCAAVVGGAGLLNR